MPGLDPGTPDAVDEPYPPEDPGAITDEEPPSIHDEDVFISRETPGDVHLFNKMRLLCGEVLGWLTEQERITIVENSRSDAALLRQQQHLNKYQENTYYCLVCITSACRLGGTDNPERYSRFAVWLQHAKLLIDNRERFDGHAEAQREYDRHVIYIDNELKSRRVLGEAYVLAITAAARIIHQSQPTTGVHFGHGILGPGREPDEETPPPSEARAARRPHHVWPEEWNYQQAARLEAASGSTGRTAPGFTPIELGHLCQVTGTVQRLTPGTVQSQVHHLATT
jgi:hypothetical protein